MTLNCSKSYDEIFCCFMFTDWNWFSYSYNLCWH